MMSIGKQEVVNIGRVLEDRRKEEVLEVREYKDVE